MDIDRGRLTHKAILPLASIEALGSLDFSGTAYKSQGRALCGPAWILYMCIGQSEWSGRWNSVIGQAWITVSL